MFPFLHSQTRLHSAGLDSAGVLPPRRENPQRSGQRDVVEPASTQDADEVLNEFNALKYRNMKDGPAKASFLV